MTVAELIAKLQALPQDMQVKLWNGSENDPALEDPSVHLTSVDEENPANPDEEIEVEYVTLN